MVIGCSKLYENNKNVILGCSNATMEVWTTYIVISEGSRKYPQIASKSCIFDSVEIFILGATFICLSIVVKQIYFRQTLHHQSFVPCTSTTNKYNPSRLLLSDLHHDTLEAIFGVTAVPLVPYKNENCDSRIYVFGIKDESRFYIRVFHLSISLKKLIQ